MPLTAGQRQWRYTAAEAGLAGTGAGSLGRFVSSTVIPDGSLHALFPELTPHQCTSRLVDYRCAAIANAHPSLVLPSVKVWIARLDTRGAAFAIGVDAAGKAAVADGQVAARVASGTTAPPGVTWVSPALEADGLAVLSLAAGESFAVWLRRTVPANAPRVDGENNVLSVAGPNP